MGIGIVLNELIKKNGTNVNELAEKIDASPQTLYSIIKRDNMKADLDILYRICEEFEVDINVFYEEYRKGRAQISGSSSLSEEQKKLLEKFDQLNEEGQERLMHSLDDLIYSGRYEKNNIHSLDKKKEA